MESAFLFALLLTKIIETQDFSYSANQYNKMLLDANIASPPYLSSAGADAAAMAFTEIKWPSNPFHKGEVALQQHAGMQDYVMSYAPQFIRSYLPDQHRQFYTDLPFVVGAARDSAGNMWATLLENTNENASFLSSPNDTTLEIAAKPVPGDALENAFAHVTVTDLGLLGIQLDTARRNRVNGRVVAGCGGTALTLTVDQSFGNCPQYIKPREKWRWVSPVTKNTTSQASSSSKLFATLSQAQIDWIETSETVFTATGYRGQGSDARFGNDASHRGGSPGFVTVENNEQSGGTNVQTIVWTEYPGNNHFNSLGNILLDPRVGIAIPDFSNGGLLQVTGTAVVEMGSLNKGERKVRLQVTAVNELAAGSLPIRWTTAESEKIDVQVSSIVDESANVKSFYLKPVDALAALPSFQAGQHLPLELTIADGKVINRSYSLSSSPHEHGYYRISVKRESRGQASSFLHDRLSVGDQLHVGRPAGDFVRTDNGNTAAATTVLLSSGIGVTPILSMLHELSDSMASDNQVVWIHGARNGRHHPLQREVDAVAKRMANLTLLVAYSQPDVNDIGSYDCEGRLTADRVQQMLDPMTWQMATFYMCGPPSFLADLHTGLEALGVHDEQIHFETF